jgi:hypothetical protein
LPIPSNKTSACSATPILHADVTDAVTLQPSCQAGKPGGNSLSINYMKYLDLIYPGSL